MMEPHEGVGTEECAGMPEVEGPSDFELSIAPKQDWRRVRDLVLQYRTNYVGYAAVIAHLERRLHDAYEGGEPPSGAQPTPEACGSLNTLYGIRCELPIGHAGSHESKREGEETMWSNPPREHVTLKQIEEEGAVACMWPGVTYAHHCLLPYGHSRDHSYKDVGGQLAWAPVIDAAQARARGNPQWVHEKGRVLFESKLVKAWHVFAHRSTTMCERSRFERAVREAFGYEHKMTPGERAHEAFMGGVKPDARRKWDSLAPETKERWEAAAKAGASNGG